MASASPFETESTSLPQFGVQSVRKILELPVQAAGFWTAVLVPFVLLGLTATGIAQQSPLLVSGLVAANLLGLLLGKDYKR